MDGPHNVYNVHSSGINPNNVDYGNAIELEGVTITFCVFIKGWHVYMLSSILQIVAVK